MPACCRTESRSTGCPSSVVVGRRSRSRTRSESPSYTRLRITSASMTTGSMSSAGREYAPGVNPSALPDQSGKVIVITGGTSGIGLETAVALAGAGATVVLSSRTPAKVDAAVAEVKTRTGKQEVHPLTLDLASFASIRSSADQLLAQWPQIHVLINNAGVYLSERQLTEDGIEMTFGTNHLG